MKTVVAFVAGGTGGHIYPAVATANQLPERFLPFLICANTPKDKLLVKSADLPVSTIYAHPKNPFKILMGVYQSIQLLSKKKVKVVAAFGGFVTVPVLIAAVILRIPIVLHEQNTVPGRVNRFFCRFAKQVCITFPESKGYFPNSHLIVTGNPVRKNFAPFKDADDLPSFSANYPIVLVIGGSQGAKAINDWIKENAQDLLDLPYNWLHLVGTRDYSAHYQGPFVSRADREGQTRILHLPYLTDMKWGYQKADYVMARAGATTIAECLAYKKKMVLIPFPHAKDNHQFFNAKSLVDRNQAILLPQDEISIKSVKNALEQSKQLNYQITQPDAAEQVAVCVVKLAGKNY